jgi:hypothetical protein
MCFYDVAPAALLLCLILFQEVASASSRMKQGCSYELATTVVGRYVSIEYVVIETSMFLNRPHPTAGSVPLCGASASTTPV